MTSRRQAAVPATSGTPAIDPVVQQAVDAGYLEIDTSAMRITYFANTEKNYE